MASLSRSVDSGYSVNPGKFERNGPNRTSTNRFSKKPAGPRYSWRPPDSPWHSAPPLVQNNPASSSQVDIKEEPTEESKEKPTENSFAMVRDINRGNVRCVRVENLIRPAAHNTPNLVRIKNCFGIKKEDFFERTVYTINHVAKFKLNGCLVSVPLDWLIVDPKQDFGVGATFTIKEHDAAEMLNDFDASVIDQKFVIVSIEETGKPNRDLLTSLYHVEWPSWETQYPLLKRDSSAHT